MHDDRRDEDIAPHQPQNSESSTSKLRRGKRHCPVCLAPLTKVAGRTRLMRSCSRATALEVQRRAAVLLPLMSEDWKLLSKNRASVSTSVEVTWRRTPLTAAGLVSVCSDPHLGFLIAHESVGFDSLRHSEAGAWKDWNLYDCDRVRGAPAV